MAISGKLKFWFALLGVAYVVAIVSLVMGKSAQDKDYHVERVFVVEKLSGTIKDLGLKVYTTEGGVLQSDEDAQKVLAATAVVVLADMQTEKTLASIEAPLFASSKDARGDYKLIHASNIGLLAKKLAQLPIDSGYGGKPYFSDEKCEALFGIVKGHVKDGKVDEASAVKEIRQIEFRSGGSPIDANLTNVGEAYDKHFAPRGNVISLNYTVIMQILNFLIFVSIMYALLWKPVVDFLDKRRDEIRSNIEGAESDKAEAEKVLAEYNKKLDDARGEAMAIMNRAEKEAQIERSQILEKAQKESTFLVEKSREQIGAETIAAKQQIRSELAVIAAEVASKVIEREVKEDDHRKFVDDFVKDI